LDGSFSTDDVLVVKAGYLSVRKLEYNLTFGGLSIWNKAFICQENLTKKVVWIDEWTNASRQNGKRYRKTALQGERDEMDGIYKA
jgi:hypothetical protein